jgi:hypothetical protein
MIPAAGKTKVGTRHFISHQDFQVHNFQTRAAAALRVDFRPSFLNFWGQKQLTQAR